MNIAMISATYTRWAVRIILFFSWIYKESVMTVFNNQTKFIHPLFHFMSRQPGVVKLPQVPKSRKPISEDLISIMR